MPPAVESPARALRRLLHAGRCSYLLEAHNALSARIAAESGAPGIWASSLTLSCSFGVPDHGELTMSQALDVLESMTSRVTVPVLFDGDTGYGHFRHFQQLVRRLERRRVAGVCIEDKAFPKQNSFLEGERQPLAPAEEFCGKLRAGLAAREDPDFVVVARTEALVAGLGLEAALERAERYVDAGADAVLVHSKAPTFAEAQAFLARFSRRVPVLCVPTTYYATPPEAFEAAGVALVVWANHLLRASIAAMRRAAERIHATGTARDVEDEVAALPDVFRLQDAQGPQDLERAYGRAPRRAVVLAASRGDDGLAVLTRDRPKCMIPVGGEAVLDKLVRNLRHEQVLDLTVVGGYRADALPRAGVQVAVNERWETTGEVGSLAVAAERLEGDVVIAYGDVMFKRWILHELLASAAPLTVVVDGSGRILPGKPADRVRASAPPPACYDEREYRLEDVRPDLPADDTHGEWIGLLRAQGEGPGQLRDALRALLAEPGGERLSLDALLRRVVAGGAPVRVLYVNGGWADIDTLVDAARGGLP